MNEIKLYGIVGVDVDFQAVESQLAKADRSEMLTVKIHSEGGSVFDGLAIYEAFKAYDGPKRAVIESLAGSIASYIATAFDEVEIASNGFIMIHEPHSGTGGDAKTHAQTAELLAKLRDSMLEAYSGRMGISTEAAADIMARETWYDAAEALEANLVDSVGKAKRAPLAISNTVPQRVYASIVDATAGGDNCATPKEPKMSEPQKPAAATIADIKTILPKAKSEFLVDCIERGLTVAQVSEAALADLTTQNESLTGELDEAKAEIEKLKAAAAKTAESTPPQGKTGQTPVATAGGQPSPVSSRSEWQAKILEYVAGGLSRDKAVARIARENPDLREKMIAEANA